MLKACHLTSTHSRYDSRIFAKECRSLARDSFEVTLVVADGRGDEEKEKVRIVDIGATKNRINRLFKAPRQVYRKAIEVDADIYHIHDPELIPYGLKLLSRNKKVVYDIHEVLREQILTKTWIPKFLRLIISKAFAFYEDWSARKFSHLIVPQPSMQRHFSRLQKTTIIYNYPILRANNFAPSKQSRFNLIYSGSMSADRGILNAVKLIELLVTNDRRYTLFLAGKIPANISRVITQSPAKENIKCLGYLNTEQLHEQYSKCYFGLILFNNVGQYYLANAIKSFEYIQNGLFLIMPNFGEWLEFNQEHRVGANVPTNNAAAIAEIIRKIAETDLQKMSERNKNQIAQKFLWSNEEPKLIAIYHNL